MGNVEGTLFAAIRDNDMAQLQSLSIERAALHPVVLADAWIEAAKYDRLEMLEYLLQHTDVSPTALDDHKRTALHYATSADVAKWLIKKGAIVTARDVDRRSPLHSAVERNQIEVAQVLADVMVDFDLADAAGERALYLAARLGRIEIAKLLVAAGAQMLARNERGLTTLHAAAGAGQSHMIHYFVEDLRVNVDVRSFNELTPLHVSALEGQVEAARELLALGADIEARSDDKSSALHYAARKGSAAMIELLVERGASTVALDSTGRLALHWAAQQAPRDVIAALLAANSNVIDQKAQFGAAPIHDAAQHDNVDAIELLMQHRADIEALTDTGDTAVSIAARLGYWRVLHTLYPPLKPQVSPNAGSPSIVGVGRTPPISRAQSAPSTSAQSPPNDGSSEAASASSSTTTTTTSSAIATSASSPPPAAAAAATTTAPVAVRGNAPITQAGESWWDYLTSIGSRKPEATAGVKRLAIVGESLDLVTRTTNMLQQREMKSNNPLVLARAFSVRKPLRVDDANLVVMCVDLAKISTKTYSDAIVNTLRKCERATLQLSHNRATAYVILFAVFSPSDTPPLPIEPVATTNAAAAATNTTATSSTSTSSSSSDPSALGSVTLDGAIPPPPELDDDDDGGVSQTSTSTSTATTDIDEDAADTAAAAAEAARQAAAEAADLALRQTWRKVVIGTNAELARAVELGLVLFVSTTELSSRLAPATSSAFHDFVRLYMAFNHKAGK